MIHLIAQFLNSEIKTKGGDAEPLDVTIGKKADAAGTAAGNSLMSWVKAIQGHLITNLSSARAALIDRLDTNVNSRAPANTALNNAVWTDVRAERLDLLDTNMNSRAPAETALSNATWTDGRAALLDMIANGGIPGTVKRIISGVAGFDVNIGQPTTPWMDITGWAPYPDAMIVNPKKTQLTINGTVTSDQYDGTFKIIATYVPKAVAQDTGVSFSQTVASISASAAIRVFGEIRYQVTEYY